MFDMTEEDVIEFIKDFELDDEFETALQYERIDIAERINIDTTFASKECIIWYFIIDTLKILNLNLSQMFVTNVMVDVSFQN